MAIVQVTEFRSNHDFTHPISSTGAKFWLAANTELTWTVPGEASQKYRAEFSYPLDAFVWVKINGTIVVPVAGTVVSTYMEQLNPKDLYVIGGDVLHLISTGTPQVGVSLLQVPA